MHRLPRSHHGKIRITLRTDLLAEELEPATQTRVPHHSLDLLGCNIVLVELLEIVSRDKRGCKVLGASALPSHLKSGKELQEYVVGFGILVADGPLVQLRNPAKLVPNLEPGGFRRTQLVVENQVPMSENEIVGSEGMAVRPLHALAQVEDENPPVLFHFPGARDVRH